MIDQESLSWERQFFLLFTWASEQQCRLGPPIFHLCRHSYWDTSISVPSSYRWNAATVFHLIQKITPVCLFYLKRKGSLGYMYINTLIFTWALHLLFFPPHSFYWTQHYLHTHIHTSWFLVWNKTRSQDWEETCINFLKENLLWLKNIVFRHFALYLI
jgi:hypothetical protein